MQISVVMVGVSHLEKGKFSMTRSLVHLRSAQVESRDRPPVERGAGRRPAPERSTASSNFVGPYKRVPTPQTSWSVSRPHTASREGRSSRLGRIAPKRSSRPDSCRFQAQIDAFRRLSERNIEAPKLFTWRSERSLLVSPVGYDNPLDLSMFVGEARIGSVDAVCGSASPTANRNRRNLASATF